MGDYDRKDRRGGYREHSGGDHREGRGFRGNRGGRGYQSGNRGYHHSGSGYKRKREESGLSEEQFILQSLILLGHRKPNESDVPIETQIEELAKLLRKDVVNKAAQLQELLLDCTVELSPHVPLYAAVIGLLNVEDGEFVAQLVQRAVEECNAALAGGDMERCRLLLRLFAALVVCNVLLPSSVVNMLGTVVAAANEIAQAGVDSDPSGRTWQAYSDRLVYMALMALPWGGPELGEVATTQCSVLFDQVDHYMRSRPRAKQPGLCVFSAPKNDNDLAATSDAGGASFLGDVVAALTECHETGEWLVEAIPRVHDSFEAQLATAQPLELEAGSILVPREVPGVEPDLPERERAAAVLEAFPPRGVIKLLAPSHTQGERPLVCRLVAEEYILDTLRYFAADRVECAIRLASGLPLPFKYESLLAEMLFSQLLRVPHPQLKPLAYSTIMVDLCKLVTTFPRSMSACVRELFARVSVLEPVLRARLAEWLAYHLSCFEYVWPWAKWRHVLEAPPFDGQRRFVSSTLSRLIRLSYWDRVRQTLSADFLPLLPPNPQPQPLPTPPEQGDDADLDPAVEDLEGVRAAQIVGLIRNKMHSADLKAWIEEQGLVEELGSLSAALSVVLRAVLTAGAKSFTHMVIALDRFQPLLKDMIQELGEPGEHAAVESVVAVWSAAPQRVVMAVDRLLALRLVSAGSVVGWVFGSGGAHSAADELAAGTTWEVLHMTINKTIARTQDVRDELVASQHALESGRLALEMASSAAEAAHEHADDEMNGEDGGAEGGRELDPAIVAAVERAEGEYQEAEEQLAERQQGLLLALEEEQGIILDVARGFASLLAEDPVQLEEHYEDEELQEAALQAWHQFTLASLQGFLRRYHLSVAPVAELVLDIFHEDTTSPQVREVVVSCLNL